MSAVERGVEAIIQKAIREGIFDDLPGKGKPLDLKENPFVGKDWQLAFHMLEQQGFALPWMDKRNEIEGALKAARDALARTWAWRAKALEAGEPQAAVEAEWRRAEERFGETVEKLNKAIADYNLEVPALVFYREKIDVQRELDGLKNPENPADV
jgi:DnaJ family protein C protein 28